MNALEPTVGPGDAPRALAKLVDFLRPRPSDITRALPDEPTRKAEAGRLRRAFEHTVGAVERTEALLLVLESDPALAQRLTVHVAASVRGRRLRELLSEQGIPEQESLIGGTFRRIRDRLLPPLPERASWLDLFSEVFSSPRDGTWVAAVPVETWQRLHRVIAQQMQLELNATESPDATTVTAGVTQLAFESRAAVAMVSHRLAALGVDPVLRRYYAPAAQNESPFLEQAHELSKWSPGNASDEAGLVKHALVLLDQCTQILRHVRKLASTQGTTTRLTTTVLRGKALVRRLELLLALHQTTDASASSRAFADLFVDLVSAWLERALGSERQEAVADYMTSNLGAVVGNAAFGFILAYVGFFGEILGLPLDIRHVTFSSAYVAWGALGLESSEGAWLLVGATVGVALIALINLAVSFGLALHIAMRARGAGVAAALRIAGALRDHLRTNGRDFLWPPRDEDPPVTPPPETTPRPPII